MQPNNGGARGLPAGDSELPGGGPHSQFNSEAFPHGPVDPALAKDIEKMLDQTSKDASGPTSAEARAEHLKRYFDQVCPCQQESKPQLV